MKKERLLRIYYYYRLKVIARLAKKLARIRYLDLLLGVAKLSVLNENRFVSENAVTLSTLQRDDL